ncbi:MAG: hypothetical protein R3B92_02550 [Patescibacteria group bacterium]
MAFGSDLRRMQGIILRLLMVCKYSEYIMDKPKFLYHGSSNPNIQIFKPFAKTYRNPKEGAVIFAAPTKAAATKFIVSCDDSWSALGRFGSTYYALYSDEVRFKNNDIGGALYTLPSNTFYIDPDYTGSYSEWVSKDAVVPVEVEHFSSGLTAMFSYGVHVYFTSPSVLDQLRSAQDHGYALLKTLTPANALHDSTFIATL